MIEEKIIKKMKELENLIEQHGNKKKVINCGLLKAGKSTLFNALANQEFFITDEIRATVSNTELELENFIIVDTPGLDANEIDTIEAFKGYKDADIIVFVHNSREGELNKIEIEALKEISKQFGGIEDFIKNIIVVLTNIAPGEIEYRDTLITMIQEQCRKLFEIEFGEVIGVDSTTYIKGENENKSLLIEAGNINELKQILDKKVNMNNFESLFDKLVLYKIEELENDISKEINQYKEEEYRLEKNIINEKILSDSSSFVNKKFELINSVVDNAFNSLSIKVESPYFGCDQRSYREYSSEYQAKSAAREACEMAIKSAAKSTRERAFNIIEECKYHSYLSSGIGEVRNKVLNEYNNIKKYYYSHIEEKQQLPVLKLNIETNTIISKYMNEFDAAYKYSTYISKDSFRESDYYLTRYSSNLDIDYDYRTEYVNGLFGYREKEVKHYTWDISGAIDDIKDSSYDIIEQRAGIAIEACREIRRFYKESFNSELNQIRNDINSNTEMKINSIKTHNKKIQSEIKLINRKVELLNGMYTEVKNSKKDMKKFVQTLKYISYKK